MKSLSSDTHLDFKLKTVLSPSRKTNLSAESNVMMMKMKRVGTL
jgi:hypothetical protein